MFQPSSLLAPSDAHTAPATRPAFAIHWLREPLIHFILLGALLFGIDHYLVLRAGDPHVITIDAAVDQQARDVFKKARGREPNEDELYSLRKVWLDNEVLYREGLAQKLDAGDTAIRERVIFKALSVIDSNLKLPLVDDKVLRDYFENNRAKYDSPARYNFQEAVLTGNGNDDALRAFVAALNAGNPGDAQAGLRVFKDRPRDNLIQAYGQGFVDALDRTAPGPWVALPTQAGLKAVKLDSMTAAKPADFAALRGVAMQDWTDDTMAEQRTAAVRALARKYTVKVVASAKAAAP
jgi:hypothetical protein